MAKQTDTEDTGIRAIISSYDNWLIKLYSMIRFSIMRQPFLEEIGQYLPTEGKILDLGCGFGLFSLLLCPCCSQEADDRR